MEMLITTGNLNRCGFVIMFERMQIMLNLKKNSRDRKIFPLALINYITLSGGGFVRETGSKIKNLTMKELIESVG